MPNVLYQLRASIEKMNRIDSIIEDHQMKMRALISTHILRMQGFLQYYKKLTIYEPKIFNREYDPRCEWSRSSSTGSLSSASTSSSSSSSGPNTPTLLPLLLKGKNAEMLQIVKRTLRTMDKTLGKQLKNTKNKKALMFKLLFMCRKFFNTLRRPMYAVLGVIGVYTSLAHFLYLPDTISTFIVSSATIKDILNGKTIDHDDDC